MRLPICKLLGVMLMLATISSSAREIVVVGTHFSHIFERTPSGEYIGLGADIMRELAQKTGNTVRFEIYPFQRAKMMVELGSADILVGLYKTPERMVHFAFADKPYYQDQMVFYARRGSAMHWNGDYSSLKGLRISKIQGWAYSEQFDALDFPYFVKLDSGIKRLIDGSIDLLACNRLDTEKMLLEMKQVGEIVPITPNISVQYGYFAFPKQAKFDELRSQFNQGFKAMISSGKLSYLARKNNAPLPNE